MTKEDRYDFDTLLDETFTKRHEATDIDERAFLQRRYAMLSRIKDALTITKDFGSLKQEMLEELGCAVEHEDGHNVLSASAALAAIWPLVMAFDFTSERECAMWKKSAEAKQRLITHAETALRSIANSACCESCQEARLVAQAALPDAPECTCQIDMHNYHCPEHNDGAEAWEGPIRHFAGKCGKHGCVLVQRLPEHPGTYYCVKCGDESRAKTAART